MTDSTNAEQAEFWSGQAGRTWVDSQATMDILLQPVLDALLTRAALPQRAHVLDIGCGTGASSLQAGDIVGPTGTVMGVDISTTMLTRARERAKGVEHVTFTQADAAEFAFDPDYFDHVISRFGVMFFADPIAAFSNIAKGMKPGATMVFAAWGPVKDNPWFTLPAQAAKTVVGAPPPVDPDAPGPFAFRDAKRVSALLRDAGLADVQIETPVIQLSPVGSLEEVAKMAVQIGPASRALTHYNASEADVQAVTTLLQQMLATYSTGGTVRVPAAINYVSARKPE